MSIFLQRLLQGLLSVLKHEEIVVFLASMMPLVEARAAIPIALGYNLSPLSAWFYAFIGSSIIAPVLLLLFVPLISLIKRTPFLKKIGKFFSQKFRQKASSLYQKSSKKNGAKISEIHADMGIYIGIFAITAIPLPLTGVWSGSIIAAILGLKIHRAVAAIILGNMLSCIIITILCVLLHKYIPLITLIITLIALAATIVLIIKIIIHKPAKSSIN